MPLSCTPRTRQELRGMCAGKEQRVPQAGPAPQSALRSLLGAGLRLQPYLLGGQQQLHSLLVLTVLQEESEQRARRSEVRLFVQVLCHQLSGRKLLGGKASSRALEKWPACGRAGLWCASWATGQAGPGGAASPCGTA